MIYHVTTQTAWSHAIEKGFFEADSLAIEGFIHMSQEHQVASVLQRYYQNVSNLLLLHVDENAITAEVKFELAPSVNELFPHVFGTINLDAVLKVESIPTP